MNLFGILALCLIACILAVVLNQYKKEYSVIISIAAGAGVLILLLTKLIKPITEITNRLSQYGVGIEFFVVALKALSIGYITQFIADICRDFGQTSIALKAEFAGKVSIFLITLPLLNSLFDVVADLVGKT